MVYIKIERQIETSARQITVICRQEKRTATKVAEAALLQPDLHEAIFTVDDFPRTTKSKPENMTTMQVVTAGVSCRN